MATSKARYTVKKILFALAMLASSLVPAAAVRDLPCPPVEDEVCRDTYYTCKGLGDVIIVRPDLYDRIIGYRSERTGEMLPRHLFRHTVRHTKGTLYYRGQQCIDRPQGFGQ
jgi:hypothetical protein